MTFYRSRLGDTVTVGAGCRFAMALKTDGTAWT
jgi:hypothetical protein